MPAQTAEQIRAVVGTMFNSWRHAAACSVSSGGVRIRRKRAAEVVLEHDTLVSSGDHRRDRRVGGEEGCSRTAPEGSIANPETDGVSRVKGRDRMRSPVLVLPVGDLATASCGTKLR